MAEPDPSTSMDGLQIPSAGLEEGKTQDMDSKLDAGKAMHAHGQVGSTTGHEWAPIGHAPQDHGRAGLLVSGTKT